MVDVSDLQNTDVSRQISDNTSKTVELLEKYGIVPLTEEQMIKVFDPKLFNLTQSHLPLMANVVQKIPDYIMNRNEQQNITIHYDNMINVEGSVDKSFSREFTQNSDKLYKELTNKLAKDLKHNGVNFVRRTTLPTVK